MANFSFDIVSEVDLQEVDNAVNQAGKEINQRYDFKGSKCKIEFKRDEKKLILVGDNEYKLSAVREVLNGRLIKRGISLKSLKFNEPQQAFEGTLRQSVDIATGIEKEKAKELVKIIKDLKLKVQTNIEGEKLRVIAAKKDDLQEVMNHLKSIELSLAISFCNYR
ncbi:MAG: YajQ family cyclic di-GMP-binding protein [Candidatus Omnitrophica bacterium]|nr:YajQ family cyclic di-GMP-binding protein [Candidatus Omnitrophota bacterium]